VLERLGKKVEAVNDFLPPKNFEFLKTTHIFKENLDVKKFNPDLIISFDAGSVNQL
jgi:nanoRNase/pAp phosphatase (c-di-AMP/oligoRNAs hydrolase)